MKKVTLFVVVLLAVTLTTGMLSAQGAKTKFGNLLLALETSVKWESQSGGWKELRQSWIAAVKNTRTVEVMRYLLLSYEINTKYEAQYPRWKDQRAAWMQSVNEATTQGALAQTLLKLEQSVKYEAQASDWKQKRNAWKAEVQALR